MSSDAVVVSAPGRVNLIGEHTDYSLLPVLPMAIQRRLRVGAEPTDDGVVQARSAQFSGVFRSDQPDHPGILVVTCRCESVYLGEASERQGWRCPTSDCTLVDSN